jgi:S-adenosylmethionine:tRNA ribosyltransferase-isomerase
MTWEGIEVVLFAERHDDGAMGRLSEGATPVTFRWEPAELPFAEVLAHFGNMPLPPYLKRDAEARDEEGYQTVYALHDGSVAAPTAGLHFTPEVLESLRQKGILTEYLTLHVGAGTFRPVAADRIGDHPMHPEAFFVRRELIAKLLDQDSRSVIAVGTTSVRSLESLYWFGVKLIQGVDDPFFLDQWDVYEVLDQDIPMQKSLEALLNYLDHHSIGLIEGTTRLIIAPSYQFRVVRGMITNFHQPASTLLLLVSAYLGENWKKAYDYALENDFRFLSFGDSCLFLKQ